MNISRFLIAGFSDFGIYLEVAFEQISKSGNPEIVNLQ